MASETNPGRADRASPWQGIWDRAAISLSGLCVVHCLLTIALLSAFLPVGSLFADPRIHEIGAMIAIFLGIIAFGQGWLSHGRIIPVIIGGIGILLMVNGLLVPHGIVEAGYTVTGVIILAAGHLLNRRFARPTA